MSMTMHGIFTRVEVEFLDGSTVPVVHKHADRLAVLRGVGEAESITLYYTADEWQAFVLGVKDGEFDGMAGSGPPLGEDGQRVIALRDSKDPDGPVMVLAVAAWTDLLDAVKAGGHELPPDMRALLDQRLR
jgi:hypothetical protein